MSGQLLELIIFAAIAIFLINRLLTMLGTTSEDDPIQKQNGKSFFGETNATPSNKQVQSIARNVAKSGILNKVKMINNSDTKKIIVADNKDDVLKGLKDVEEKIPNFSLENFLKGAKSAFKMIIQAGNNNNEDELTELVDKRYIEHFKEMAPSYGEYKAADGDIKAEVSEVYTFGNNVFIKVLFVGNNITNKIKSMHEEWTFSRSALSEGPAWHLTNIDRPQ